MICISHLLPDEEMKEFTQKYGTGIESIDLLVYRLSLNYVFRTAP